MRVWMSYSCILFQETCSSIQEKWRQLIEREDLSMSNHGTSEDDQALLLSFKLVPPHRSDNLCQSLYACDEVDKDKVHCNPLCLN
jgi:hypothetical protein